MYFFPLIYFLLVVDLIFRDLGFGPWKIGGTVLIVVGFLIMLLPEPWQEKVYCCKPTDSANIATVHYGDEGAANTEGGIDNPSADHTETSKEKILV